MNRNNRGSNRRGVCRIPQVPIRGPRFNAGGNSTNYGAPYFREMGPYCADAAVRLNTARRVNSQDRRHATSGAPYNGFLQTEMHSGNANMNNNNVVPIDNTIAHCGGIRMNNTREGISPQHYVVQPSFQQQQQHSNHQLQSQNQQLLQLLHQSQQQQPLEQHEFRVQDQWLQDLISPLRHRPGIGEQQQPPNRDYHRPWELQRFLSPPLQPVAQQPPTPQQLLMEMQRQVDLQNIYAQRFGPTASPSIPVPQVNHAHSHQPQHPYRTQQHPGGISNEPGDHRPSVASIHMLSRTVRSLTQMEGSAQQSNYFAAADNIAPRMDLWHGTMGQAFPRRNSARSRMRPSQASITISGFPLNLLQYAHRLGLDHPRGLARTQINKIFSYKFNPGTHSGGQTSCAMCMRDFEARQLVRVLPCSHQFHAESVARWLQSNTTCPICRQMATNFFNEQ